MNYLSYIIILIFWSITGYGVGQVDPMTASLINKKYDSYLGNMYFPLSDLANLEVSEITNRVKKGIDPNHYVTGTVYIDLNVPDEVAGRKVLQANLEKIDNRLNTVFTHERGCSLYIHSNSGGEREFRILMEVSAPKIIFNSSSTKKQSESILKKCIRTTLRENSFKLNIELPVRLDLESETQEFKTYAEHRSAPSAQAISR